MKFLLLAIPFLAAAQQGAIEGVAFNKLTKAPVPGVRVRMTSYSERSRHYEAVTGLDGKYRIPNLPAGEYSPYIDPPSGMYGPAVRDIVFARVCVSDATTTYDVPISPPADVRGRVLDSDRHPAARASVTALPLDGLLPGMASTDSNGLFSIRLAPGKYRLRVQPASGGWAPTFYPSAPDPSAAEVVNVGDGAGLDGLDVRLRPAVSTCLSGIVRDDAGKPASGVELSLFGNDISGPRTTSDSQGRFEFTAVPRGDWKILATVARDGARWLGTETVTMPDRDYDRAEVRIYPPFSLEAEVDGLPEERRGAVIPDLRPAAGFVLPYAQARDGGYVFDRVYSGAYRVAVRGIVFGYYLKSILLGAADITGQLVDLGPSSPPLRFIYAPSGGHISGEVEDGAGAKVVLIWADREHYIPGADSLTITCSDTGRFTSPDLRPGAWYVLAFPPPTRPQSADALRNAVFDRGLWGQAASVRIAEGETTDVKLKMTPWMKILLILLAPLLTAAQGAIEGVAYNKATKAPVPRVQVRMTADAEPARYYDAFTAADGSYRIDNLPAGPYSPWINPPEGLYGPDPLEMAVKRTRVVVKEGATRFDVEITPPSLLRGRVFDSDGQPLPGATVTAQPAANRLPSRAETDEQGRYSLGVQPGRYRLQVRPTRASGAGPRAPESSTARPSV